MQATGADYLRGNPAAFMEKHATHKLSTWFYKGKVTCNTAVNSSGLLDREIGPERDQWTARPLIHYLTEVC